MRRGLLVLGGTITAMLLGAWPALAQEPTGTLHINSAELVSHRQIDVTGTIECLEGLTYNVAVEVFGPAPRGMGVAFTSGTCTTSGRQSWSLVISPNGQRTFDSARRVHGDASVCPPSGECFSDPDGDNRTL
jgi:hypothetical protein